MDLRVNNRIRLAFLSLTLTLALGPAAFSQELKAEAKLDPYQVGSEWGKKRVTEELLDSETKEFIRAAKATVSVGRATGFYLGKINNEHFLATNYHVIESADACRTIGIRLPLMDVRMRCKKHLGSWSDIDLSLQTVEIVLKEGQELDEIERALSEVAKNFSFSRKITKGLELTTIGFGMHKNPFQRMVANTDDDCRVFSTDADYRYISDPDQINPGPYKVWSFAHGCDASHGDSGSAMVDRKTGEVIGIIWTGAFPKLAETQDSKVLNEWLRDNNEKMIWTQLSYAVPAEKIAELIRSKIEEAKTQAEPSLDQESIALLEALLDDGGAAQPSTQKVGALSY